MAAMNPDTTYSRTLKRAAELAGGEATLAQALGISPEVLRKWVSGQLQPPTKFYLAALDFLSRAGRKNGAAHPGSALRGKRG